MSRIALVAFTASALAMTTVVGAQAQNVAPAQNGTQAQHGLRQAQQRQVQPIRQVPQTSQTTRAPEFQASPDVTQSQPRPLFFVAGVPVGVWAPVQAPYDVHADRPAAAIAMWDEDGRL